MITIDRKTSYFNMCEDAGFDNMVMFNWLDNNGFFVAPASSKYHGAYDGGLFDHSAAVAKRLIKLTHDNNLHWVRGISPFVVGMFHDLCKIDQYTKIKGETESNYSYTYNTDLVLSGHGSKSVILLSQFMPLTEEEILCIRYHMGPYEKEEWHEFDLAIREYENVLYTHLADMLASKVDNV